MVPGFDLWTGSPDSAHQSAPLSSMSTNTYQIKKTIATNHASRDSDTSVVQRLLSLEGCILRVMVMKEKTALVSVSTARLIPYPHVSRRELRAIFSSGRRRAICSM